MRTLLKVALPLVLVMICPSTVYSAKAPKPDLFEVLFYQHVDRTNATLSTLLGVSCDDSKALADAAQIVADNADKMAELISKVPDSQPESIQVKEIETGYGVLFVVHQGVTTKIKQCVPPEVPIAPATNGD